MNIVFAGTAEFAVPTLKKLLKLDLQNQINLQAIITAPDKPRGRGLKLQASPVKNFLINVGTEQCSVPTLLTRPINRLYSKLKKLNPDLIIVIAYGQKLNKKILSLPKYGCMNIHPSLLPKYRGPAPIQAAIFNGDKETGVSIIKMDGEIDHGPILMQKKIKIAENETGGTLHNKLAELGANLSFAALRLYSSKAAKLTPQDHARASCAKKLTRAQAEIDWSKSASKIEQMIRAYNPWPGAFAFLKIGNKKIRIKIFKAKRQDGVGSVLASQQAGQNQTRPQLIFPCGHGNLMLQELQPEGKNKMTGEEFLRGYPILPKHQPAWFK